MNEKGNTRGRTIEECQPDYDDPSTQPQTLTKSRHIDGIYHVAGRPPVKGEGVESEIMFVAIAVEDEEASQSTQSTFGMRIPMPSEYLKGSNIVLKDVARTGGVDIDQCYYTAAVKWVLPRSQRARPNKRTMKWGLPILEDEISRVKPRIIVCLGKHVFDLIGPQKISFKDAHGCWFWSEDYQAHMYVMHAPHTLVTKPEFYEMFRVDFREIARRKELLDSGLEIAGNRFNYRVIRDEEDLGDWLAQLEEEFETGWQGHLTDEGRPILSMDGEWEGKTHVDGKLRTLQCAWTENETVVIEFRDEKTEASFECDAFTKAPETPAIIYERKMGRGRVGDAEMYARVGARMAATFERIDARFIAHHYAADAPWMCYWLGIDVDGKCELDTEFAQQVCDESSELGLERGIAMKYTNLGRYDQELTMWKRENKSACANGYGFIPSAILIPYAAADTIAPMRAYPLIKRQLQAQRLWEYYRDIFNPFVTDVFTDFCMVGLPTDKETMDDLRGLFTWSKGKLEAKLQQRIASDARTKFKNIIIQEFGLITLLRRFKAAPSSDAESSDEVTLNDAIDKHDVDIISRAVKGILHGERRSDEVANWLKKIEHIANAPAFNIRSSKQLALWLFSFEGLTPIKSTGQKAKGLPSMAWESVLKLPPDKQALYKPAVDKQTLEILAQQLPAIDELLNLNAVGNLSKAFMKEPDVYIDGDTGEEVVEEHGLHAWRASDGRIHGMMSTTESGRSRSWSPNTLNWPAYVNKRVAKTIERLIREAHEEGDLPENMLKWVDVPGDKLPTIRSIVKAPEGKVFVESDYATAEMVALAIISGDADLMRILFEPDPDWVKLKPDNPFQVGSVRYQFSDAKLSGIPESAQGDKYIMHVWENGECKGEVTEDMLLRDENGDMVHAKYDIHWSLIERTYEKPREELNSKTDRGAAKVLNFCQPGNVEVLTRENSDDAAINSTPLAEVSTSQLVWDGVEWVHHAGVIRQGYRGVIEYDGVQATPEHVVYTEGHGPTPLVDAAMSGLRLVRSSPDQGNVADYHDVSRWGEKRQDLEGRVRLLREVFEALDDEPSQVERSLRMLRTEVPGQGISSDAGLPIRIHGAAMPEGYACVFAELQRQGNRGQDDPGGVHSVGDEELAEQGVSGLGLRSNRQRRALRDVQSQVGYEIGEPQEYEEVEKLIDQSSEALAEKEPLGAIHGEDRVEQAAARAIGGPDSGGSERLEIGARNSESKALAEGAPRSGVLRQICGASMAGREVTNSSVGGTSEETDRGRGRESEGSTTKPPTPNICSVVSEHAYGVGIHGADDTEEARKAETLDSQIRFIGKVRVYDILNAGPRHRFTCSGVLVSNSSAYGASANSLERKIESDTGSKPPEGTGERGLEAIEERQPVATKFLEDMAEVPKRKGMYRCASGRIRHASNHAAGAGVNWRVRNSIESALGREFRNLPMQESVGATAARACCWLRRAYRKLGLSAQVMTSLYDSIVTLCDLEERHLVKRLHQLCMSDINAWEYNDDKGRRFLRFSIDTDIVWRWSTPTTKEEQKNLESRDWKPASSKCDFLEQHSNLQWLAGLGHVKPPDDGENAP